MSNQNTNHPKKVFISYSWDSKEHKDKILKFSERLKSDGIDSKIDQDEELGPPEGWQVWMNDQIRQADFVLMVCSEKYYNIWNKTVVTDGAMWEIDIVRAILYKSKGKNTKFICIVFSQEELEYYIPESLQQYQNYMLDSQENYERLLRRIFNKPSIVQSQIGNPPDLSSRQIPLLTFGSSDSLPKTNNCGENRKPSGAPLKSDAISEGQRIFQKASSKPESDEENSKNSQKIVKDVTSGRDLSIGNIRQQNQRIQVNINNLNLNSNEKTEISKISTKENNALQSLKSLLENLPLKNLKLIYKSSCLQNSPQIVGNIEEIIKELNSPRSSTSNNDRPILDFVRHIIQNCPVVSQELRNWLYEYEELFKYKNSVNGNTYIPDKNRIVKKKVLESSLLIIIDSEQPDRLHLKAWFWSSQSQNLVQEEEIIKIGNNVFDKSKRYQKFADKLTELIKCCNKFMREVGSEDLRIEFFLPIKLLKRSDFYYEWIEIKKLGILVKLCSQYTVVFRSTERLNEDYQDLKGKWKRKWEQINSSSLEGIITYTEKFQYQLDKSQTIGVKLDVVTDEVREKVLGSILLEATPFALWSRCALKTTQSKDEINRILASASENFQQLPEVIKQERKAAETVMEHIGHHICLLWEDPERIPPNTTNYPLSSL